MNLCTSICVVLLLFVLCCESHVIEKRKVYSTTASPPLTVGITSPTIPSLPDCAAKCSAIVQESSSALYVKAANENAYAQNLCSKGQEAIACLKGIILTCPSVTAQLNDAKFQFRAACQREGSCRLAEPLFCLSEVAGEEPNVIQGVCQNFQYVMSCVRKSLRRISCTPKNTASRFWSYLLTSFEPFCFNVSSTPNQAPCNFPFDEARQCVAGFKRELIQGVLTGEFSGSCRELDPLKICFQRLTATVTCYEAKALIKRLISLFEQILFGACIPPSKPPSCGSHGNVYSVVPNTYCTKFTQSVSGHVAGTHWCPRGTRFDTSVCVCNHAYSVKCSPPSCGSHGNVYSIVPNTRCTKFTQSVNGYVAGTHWCPRGTRFDTSNGVCVCNHAYRVKCIG